MGKSNSRFSMMLGLVIPLLALAGPAWADAIGPAPKDCPAGLLGNLVLPFRGHDLLELLELMFLERDPFLGPAAGPPGPGQVPGELLDAGSM